MREHVGPAIQLEIIHHHELVMDHYCTNSLVPSLFQHSASSDNSMITSIYAAETAFLSPSILHAFLLPLIDTTRTTCAHLFDPDDKYNTNGAAITYYQEMDYQQRNNF